MNRRWGTVIAACWFGFLTAIVSPGGLDTKALAGSIAAVTAAPLWYLLVERVSIGPRLVRGTVAGLLTGLLGVPVLLAVYGFVTTGGTFVGTYSGGVFGVYGLLIAGWQTGPVGAVIGGLLALVRRFAD